MLPFPFPLGCASESADGAELLFLRLQACILRERIFTVAVDVFVGALPGVVARKCVGWRALSMQSVAFGWAGGSSPSLLEPALAISFAEDSLSNSKNLLRVGTMGTDDKTLTIELIVLKLLPHSPAIELSAVTLRR